MKTTFTFVILFFSQFISLVQAQEWAPVGATWHFRKAFLDPTSTDEVLR